VAGCTFQDLQIGSALFIRYFMTAILAGLRMVNFQAVQAILLT
jgi:hypothetical protein